MKNVAERDDETHQLAQPFLLAAQTFLQLQQAPPTELRIVCPGPVVERGPRGGDRSMGVRLVAVRDAPDDLTRRGIDLLNELVVRRRIHPKLNGPARVIQKLVEKGNLRGQVCATGRRDGFCGHA